MGIAFLKVLQENAPWNLNFEPRHEPHLYYGQWPGHTYNPSPSDWRSLAIYQRLGLDMLGLILYFIVYQYNYTILYFIVFLQILSM